VPRRSSAPVAKLWQLAWNGDSLSCAVYRSGKGFEMRLESARGTLLTEKCDLRPRALARMQALRRSLKRRGWEDQAR
jgi:hypothetical protein